MNNSYLIQSFVPHFCKNFISLCGIRPQEAPLPYTLHTDIELKDFPIHDIHKIIVLGWQVNHIDNLDLSKKLNETLLDLIHSGSDLTGKWSDITQVGSTSIIACEFRRINPEANIRFVLRSQSKKKIVRIFITIFDTNQNSIKKILNEVLDIFNIFAQRQETRVFSITPGEISCISPITVGFKIFHELVFRGTPPIHIPKYMSSGPDDTWKVNLCTNKIDPSRKVIKETIKTEKGIFNVQRYATEKEQRKGAKKAKREKLEDKVARQDKALEDLQNELKSIQKAYSTLLNSSNSATSKRDREIESLRKKIEQLKKSKDFAIEKKNEEIDEIQKIADQMLEHHNQEKERIENDNKTFDRKLQDADWQIQNLQAQVSSLRQRQERSGIVIPPEQETEKFAGEFEVALMSALHFAMENSPVKSNSCKLRSRDIWQAFITANSEAESRYKSYKQDVNQLLNASRKNNFMRNTDILNKFGIKCDSYTNNHKKIRFADNDPRYSSCYSSTPSDNFCGAKNFTDDLKNAFFYY